jgi:hypothetical protein
VPLSEVGPGVLNLSSRPPLGLPHATLGRSWKQAGIRHESRALSEVDLASPSLKLAVRCHLFYQHWYQQGQAEDPVESRRKNSECLHDPLLNVLCVGERLVVAIVAKTHK